MRAKDVPRDISSRKQDVPAPGDGAASEWLRSYLQESIRPPFGHMASIPGILCQPTFQSLPGRITQVLDHLGRTTWAVGLGVAEYSSTARCRSSGPDIRRFSHSVSKKTPASLIKFYGHSLGTADYSYFQAIFDQIDLYGGNTTLYFLHAPRITPVFLRRFGCEFR